MSSQIERGVDEVMRDEMTMRERIMSLLNESPKTVPELAGALACSTNDVVMWIMAMWRYGSVEETGKPDSEGYYHYRPTE